LARSIDSHIFQLSTLQGALQYHPNKLPNKLPPIYTIPIEVLSRIFEQLVVILHENKHFRWYRACLSHAFVLRSVSTHFRHVALGTPALWKGVAIYIPNRKSVGSSLSLLKHCISLAASVNVSIIDQLDEEEACLAIDALFTADTIPKIGAFELMPSAEATTLWIKKLKGSSFPMLDALSMNITPSLNFDFGSLKTVTRLSLCGTSIHKAIVAPPSLQYLTTTGISIRAMVSLLYQCPKLVEFSAIIYPSHSEEGIKFNKPLTLGQLKRLTIDRIDFATTPPPLPNLRLPSLETLELIHHNENHFIEFILLCQNVSATLKTLKIRIASEAKLEKDEAYQLWKLPFPHLRELEFTSISEAAFESAICMLELRADECCNTESRCLPSLTKLTLRCSSKWGPRCLLDFLRKLKIGDASYFYLEFRCSGSGIQDWPPDLREELRSIVGSRRIDVSWNGNKILRLPRAAGSSSQKAKAD
jgi:hypothetical protein